MSSDPPLHVALGSDLRRPSVRLLKVIRVESRVSDGSAPFCAIYRAFAKVVGRERHVVFPSSKSILEGKCVSYSYDEVLG